MLNQFLWKSEMLRLIGWRLLVRRIERYLTEFNKMCEKQNGNGRMNTARTRVKACSRRFLCAVDELNRKIVISAQTRAVGFLGKAMK